MSNSSNTDSVTPNINEHKKSTLDPTKEGQMSTVTTGQTVTEAGYLISIAGSGDPKLYQEPAAVDENNNSQISLVDKVTEKIRGQSMVDGVSPAKPNAHQSHSGSEGDSSDKETSRKRKLSSQSSVATETAVRQHLKRPKESDVPEREEDPEDVVANTSAQKSSKTRQTVSMLGVIQELAADYFFLISLVLGPLPPVNPRFLQLRVSKSTSPTPVPASELEKHSASKAAEFIPNSKNDDPTVPRNHAVPSLPQARPRPTSGGFAAFASVSPYHDTKSPVEPASNINPTSPPRESLAGPVRRSKSPVGKHQAFGQYSTGISRFGTHNTRKSTQDEGGQSAGDRPEKDTSAHPEFADILQAKGEPGVEVDDNSTKMEMQRIQSDNTGEEEDFTVFQTRAKLYTQDEQFAYKERGTGLLKVNVRRSDGEGARIVMRAEGVLRLLLNMALYPGLICELGPDPKFVKVAEITPNERKFHAIKVGSTKLAQELFDHLTENTVVIKVLVESYMAYPDKCQATYPWDATSEGRLRVILAIHPCGLQSTGLTRLQLWHPDLASAVYSPMIPLLF
ncbi:ranBP1 domain-containing protein [Rhizoctonia solani AG-1 IA]|uniref:RanBP1 domain-containing protein n=1 Tax=Thanatephorus cucumeris (strain AG1-IA) TaxID=983506 RepID=L8WE61_THACA|nr:ranBP1 domain-containing protein [Rhizoctonia solani AG-1 IA]